MFRNTLLFLFEIPEWIDRQSEKALKEMEKLFRFAASHTEASTIISFIVSILGGLAAYLSGADASCFIIAIMLWIHFAAAIFLVGEFRSEPGEA